jgi:hypothetical protein
LLGAYSNFQDLLSITIPHLFDEFCGTVTKILTQHFSILTSRHELLRDVLDFIKQINEKKLHIDKSIDAITPKYQLADEQSYDLKIKPETTSKRKVENSSHMNKLQKNSKIKDLNSNLDKIKLLLTKNDAIVSRLEENDVETIKIYKATAFRKSLLDFFVSFLIFRLDMKQVVFICSIVPIF